MPKTEVYSWRVSPAVKDRLEAAARREGRSVAALLEDLVTHHLAADEDAAHADEARQQELHARAARLAGSVAGADPDRSVTVRQRVRARLGARTTRGR
jgi:predicted DNA-binding protein